MNFMIYALMILGVLQSGLLLWLCKQHIQQNKKIKHIMIAIDDLIADAQDESTVDDSIISLLTSISAQLGSAGTDQAKLQQLKDLIDANKAKISAAIVANTPAAPNL